MAKYKLGGKTPATRNRVMRYKGTFDWINFYKELFNYFVNHRYEFEENRFKDTGKGIKLDLFARRKVDEWLFVEYKIKFILYNLKREKHTVNGETRELFNGMMDVEISGTFKMDSNNIFKGKSKFLELLGKIYIMVKTRDWETGIQDAVDYGVRAIFTEMRRLLNSWTKDAHDWGISSA